MKKLSMITIATMLVIVACFALVACNVTPNDNNGGNGDNGGDGVISAADGNGATLVIGEANFDIFQDEYTVGTPTLALDEVKANILNLGDDLVAINIVGIGENGQVEGTKYVFSKNVYMFQPGEGALLYTWNEDECVVYRRVFPTQTNWDKTITDTAFMDEEEMINEIKNNYVNPTEGYFADMEFSEPIFDDNSIVYTAITEGGQIILRIKKYTNYNWTFPEAELQNIEE